MLATSPSPKNNPRAADARQISIIPLVWILLAFLLSVGGSLATSPELNAATTTQEAASDSRRPRPEKFEHPAVIQFHGEIDMFLTQYFKNRFERARRSGVDLLIIEIDSPGGLKIQSLEMAAMIRDCKWAYVVCIVTHEAISGGALVTLGCDELFIAPNAIFGDIGEIAFDPEASAWRLIEPKIESYLSSKARTLAKSKGRSPELAEAMVDKDVLVFIKRAGEGENGEGKREDAGDSPLEFRIVRVDDAHPPQAPWELVPETGPERFLTLSGERAQELGIAQHSATSLDDLYANLGVNADDVNVFQKTSTDRVVYFLNNPFVTFLLVVVGLIALYVEFCSAGIGAGGLVSGLCATLFFWSRFLGGTSGWLEVILFVAGIVFLLMEVFVIPGFGVSGIAGMCLLLASVVLASQDFVMPHTAHQWNQSLTTLLMVMCSGVVFLLAASSMSKLLGSVPIFNRLVLAPQPATVTATPPKDEMGKPIPQPHPQISVGDWGTSESLLRPAGRAKFAGRSFDVISDGSFVEPDQQVKVVRIAGNVITVAQIEPSGDETTWHRSDT